MTRCVECGRFLGNPGARHRSYKDRCGFYTPNISDAWLIEWCQAREPRRQAIGRRNANDETPWTHASY